MERNRAIDYEKGITVAMMVLCHVLQFFGRTDIYPEQYWIITVICSTAFPTFLFAYGHSVFLAYYRKPLRQAAPRILFSSMRAYGAYCISGIAHHVVCSKKYFSGSTIFRVITFQDVPGMSEFLATFAVLGLVTLILFPVFNALLDHKAVFWTVTLACFAGAFIPYDQIHSTHLGLFIGTTSFYAFPVLQYFPFFLTGLYVGRYGMKCKALWLGGSGLLTVAGITYFIIYGEPVRFPPSLWWLILPCLEIVLLDWGAETLQLLGKQHFKTVHLLAPIESMGRNSLYYLLASNLILFSVRRMGTIPLSAKNAVFPFTLAANSTPWALFWTLILLLSIAFMAGLYRKAPKKTSFKPDNRSQV